MKLKDIHKSSRTISRFLPMTLSLVVTVTVFSLSSVTYAQENSFPQAVRQLSANLKKMEKTGTARSEIPEEPIRFSTTADGYIRHIGAPPSHYFEVKNVVPGKPEKTARNFLREYAGEFGAVSEAVDLSVTRSRHRNKRDFVRFKQTYSGIPVFGAALIVQLNETGGVEYVMSDIARDVRVLDEGTVSIAPSVSDQGAVKTVTDLFAEDPPGIKISSTQPELKIYAPSILDKTGGIRLVWDMKVSSREAFLSEQILVDAHSGEIVLRYSLIHRAMQREVYDGHYSLTDSFYGPPGWDATLERSDSQDPPGPGPSPITDVNHVWDYLEDTYNFFWTEHGRDSWDDNGMILNAAVKMCAKHSPCPHINAYWYTTCDPPDPDPCYNYVTFQEGVVADDVVAHEYTHGVTFYELNLKNTNQAGSIKESLSDMWAEFVDMTNGAGTDTPAVAWLAGEDVRIFTANTDNDNMVEDGRAGGSLGGDAVGDGIPENIDLFECHGSEDDDGDGFINEGCPEIGDECENGIDDDGDGFINEGCPETGAACENSVDDDGDGFVNEGCPGTCIDGIDNAGDGAADVADRDCYMRNMRNPPAAGGPDRMGSELYYLGELGNGGVYQNGNVGNKLAYLLTEGDTFNGQTITGMGISRVADLYYEVQISPLTSPASNYVDLGSALYQAALNLGWTTPERLNLNRALYAVEIINVVFADWTYDGSEPEDGTIDYPFDTITEAYDAASRGDRLIINKGSYNETITFDKPLQIKARRRDVIIGQ